jgi:hypothetical protein
VSWCNKPTKDQCGIARRSTHLILLLIMVPSSGKFDVPPTSVLAVFTVTLWLRLLGATASGWLAANQLGRRTSLLISIRGYSLCNSVIRISPSLVSSFVCHAALDAFMGAELPAQLSDIWTGQTLNKSDHEFGIQGPKPILEESQ